MDAEDEMKIELNLTATMHSTIWQKAGLTHHAFNTISTLERGDGSITRQVCFLVAGTERNVVFSNVCIDGLSDYVDFVY